MGGQRFAAVDWADYSNTTKAKSQDQIFKKKTIDKALDPVNFTVRESVDSPANPESTPIMIFVDETGSMGVLAEQIIKKGLGVVMTSLYDRLPVKDPHVMVGGVGDVYSDNYPVQASQFEAGVAQITPQIENIVIEGNGGGNGGESYIAVWYLAAFKTKIDSMIKRNKKGYLFTVGDEPPHLTLSRQHVKQFFGDDIEADLSAKALLDLVSQSYEVFHIRVGHRSDGLPRWRELLNERAIDIGDNIDKLGEVIVSTIQVVEGHDPAKVTKSWDGSTNLVVASAVGALTAANKSSSDIVRL